MLATLIRLLGDFHAAEEALHDAFIVALDRWTELGAPDNPRTWLVSTGRFKAIGSRPWCPSLTPSGTMRWKTIVLT